MLGAIRSRYSSKELLSSLSPIATWAGKFPHGWLNDEVPSPNGESPALCASIARGASISTVEMRRGDLRNPVYSGRGWTRFALRLRGEGTSARRAWRAAYVRRVILGDAICASLAVAAAYMAGLGPAAEPRAALLTALALPLAWLGVMAVSRSYEQRFLWIGAEEFRRVSAASVMLLGAVGTLSWAVGLGVTRGFVVTALPIATVGTLLQRYAQRKALHWARRAGRCQQTTLLVGHRGGVAALDEQLQREAYHGYRVIGCCLPNTQQIRAEDAFNGLPILGTLHQVADVVDRYEIDAVAVLPCPELEGAALRRLGWALEGTRAELLLAPAITEVVGPRVRIRSVSGLPLMHMERPEFGGVRRLAKELVDMVASAFLLFMLTPALVGIAVAVKMTSPGPVFFRQERIGRDGAPFLMLKFRTMVEDADRRLGQLSAASDGNGVLFKIRDDPRVTRVGKVLRRYSLDEIPQLVNVLRGQMSLVGPRPPLAAEVERYGSDMHRRFLVKPGLTGLWQVSGRSDLSWRDSMRADIGYVENWSLMFDLMILWKTVGAVLRRSGAY